MHTVHPPRSHSPAAWSACAFFLACLSFAHGQATPPATRDLPPVTLEEYTVSGERAVSYKTERVQMGAFRDVDPVDIPISIDVITREAMDAQQGRSILDAVQNTAGVTHSQISGSVYDNIALRGITVENRGNYRLNGSLPVINLVDLSMENKERVEVLKGSAGLYYGFVPPSGIINMVTKRAGAKPVTSLELSANSFGALGAHLDVGRRLGARGQVGLRLNLATSSEDLGLDHYTGHREFESLAGDWRITDKLLVKIDVEHVHKNVPEQAAIVLPAAVGGVITLPPVPPNTRNFGGSWQRYDAQATNMLARADYLISKTWTILVEAGQAITERDRALGQLTLNNVTTGASTLRVSFTPETFYENKNGRAEVFGRLLTGPIRHDLTFGVTANERFQDNGAAGAAPAFATNYYNPLVPPPVNPPNPITRNASVIHDSGFYAFDRLATFNERLQFIVGARDTNYSSTSIVSGAVQVYKQTNTTHPIASALFKPSTRSSVYVSYIESPEPGGVAGTAQANAGQMLPPLVSKQWEAGTKVELFHGALAQLNAFQIDRPGTFIDATNRLVPNGLSRFKGAELFVSGEVTPSVSVLISGLLLDARQTSAANAATLNRTPENTPKKTASLFLEWHTPFAKGFAVSAGAYYTGRQPVNNTDQAYFGGYTTFTAGASYRFKLGRLNYIARVNGVNVGDKDTWSTAGAGLLGATFPRLWKFSLTTSF
jgi:iron complex outermembrane recepter protein